MPQIVHEGDAEQDRDRHQRPTSSWPRPSPTATSVTGDGADAVINTGMPHQAAAIRARFAEVSDKPDPRDRLLPRATRTISVAGRTSMDRVSRSSPRPNYPDVSRLLERFLRRFLLASHRGDSGSRDIKLDASQLPPDPVPTVTFHDRHEFLVGGSTLRALLNSRRRKPPTSLIVWLPDERTVVHRPT